MQPCKTGDQPYSDPFANGECSLDTDINGKTQSDRENNTYRIVSKIENFEAEKYFWMRLGLKKMGNRKVNVVCGANTFNLRDI